MTKIFIDGRAGTTGLQIEGRMGLRDDVTLIELPESLKKDPAARKGAIQEADYVFLCLPDAAAMEAAEMVEDSGTRIIDASTAHRTNPAWAYGFPELSKAHREKIQTAQFVANPGCHATGFISSVYPLVQAGLIAKDEFLTCFSLTGYSGGGKKMIAQYEGEEKPAAFASPRIYGLNQSHKHLPEMQQVCGLTTAPAFSPIVDDYYKGMATTIALPKSAESVQNALAEHYKNAKLVQVHPLGWDESMVAANTMAGRDILTLIVNGNDQRCTVTALFDNLGKGASGAAVQNMNLMLGFEETAGLNL